MISPGLPNGFCKTLFFVLIIFDGERAMTRLYSVLALLTCGFWWGCVQYEHALSPLAEATYDKQIFGSWHYHSVNSDGRSEHIYLHIGPTEETEGAESLDQNYYLLGSKRPEEEVQLKKMTRIVIVLIKPDRKVSQLSFLAFPSMVDGHHYMNAPLIMKGKIYSYGIVKYELDGDKLKVWGEAADDAIKHLFQEGKLHESDKGNVIVENTEALRKVFLKNDTLLFPPNAAGTFDRIAAK